MSKWIDADAYEQELRTSNIIFHYGEQIIDKIYTAPSIDIVRCKECKWWVDNLTENDDDEAYDSCRWDWSRKIPTADDFCSYGEVRDE